MLQGGSAFYSGAHVVGDIVYVSGQVAVCGKVSVAVDGHMRVPDARAPQKGWESAFCMTTSRPPPPLNATFYMELEPIVS